MRRLHSLFLIVFVLAGLARPPMAPDLRQTLGMGEICGMTAPGQGGATQDHCLMCLIAAHALDPALALRPVRVARRVRAGRPLVQTLSLGRRRYLTAQACGPPGT